MFYKYSETAGYYGNGAWIIYGRDWNGHKSVYHIADSEADCIARGAKLEAAA